MEEIKNGEQLEETLANVQNGIVEKEDDGTTWQSENSSLGKFKDATSLLNAYNSLQAEFTRKCQKLSELSKRFEDEEIDSTDDKIAIDDKNSEEIIDKSLSNEKLAKKLDDESKQNAETLIFESKDWKDRVSAFLMENSEAKEYSGEIANEIFNDKNLQSSPHALELAWAKVIKKEYKNPKNLVKDQKFINEQILTNDEIKRQVIDEYFKNLQDRKVPPLITKSGSVAGITYKEPTTMKEAKMAVERLFNLKGN